MATSAIDLDINNYDYYELLQIYKLPATTKELNIKKMDAHLATIKSKFPKNIQLFYLKVYKLIVCINKIFKTSGVLHIDNKIQVAYFVNKIKKIRAFEEYDTDELIVLLQVNSTEPSQSITGVSQLDIYNEKIKPVSNTYQYPVAPGNLNSIKRVTQLQNLNLNTCFRNNYGSSNPCDFQYIIPTEIKNVLSMRLASIEIPNSWYLFSTQKKNNLFTIDIAVGIIITTYSISVPDGNYDDESLQFYLNNTYFYQSDATSELRFIKFSIDPHSFKSKFELLDALAPPHTSFTVHFLVDKNQNLMNTLGWTMGFRCSKYKSISAFLVSEGLFDAGGDRYIYMVLNDYQYNTNTLNVIGFADSIMDENIIAKIPMVNGKLSLIIDDSDNPLSKVRKYNGPVNIRHLHVKIMDKFGGTIDLNHMDFSFTLELELLYECFNFKDVTG